MFVLRFKPETSLLIFNEEARTWLPTDVSGRYYAYTPAPNLGDTTTNLAYAKVFNTKEQAERTAWKQYCDVVPVNITLS